MKKLLTFLTLSTLTISTLGAIPQTQAASPTPAPKASTKPTTPVVKASVKVSDQAVKANKITVTEVVAAQDGWIVIHEMKDGKPGAILGEATVKKGKNTNVLVTIKAVKTGTKLSAMLHIDAGTKGKFDPATDTPVKDVMVSFTTK